MTSAFLLTVWHVPQEYLHLPNMSMVEKPWCLRHQCPFFESALKPISRSLPYFFLPNTESKPFAAVLSRSFLLFFFFFSDLTFLKYPYCPSISQTFISYIYILNINYFYPLIRAGFSSFIYSIAAVKISLLPIELTWTKKNYFLRCSGDLFVWCSLWIHNSWSCSGLYTPSSRHLFLIWILLPSKCVTLGRFL